MQSKEGKVLITKAIGYIRVSTQDQAESGLGLDAQERRIRAYCEAQGWELMNLYCDAGLSAKDLKRPGLQSALCELSPGCILIALKLDRLTRCARDLEDLTDLIQSKGSDWATVEDNFDTSTAMGRCMLRVVACFAQMEREVTIERITAALNQKRLRGERLGTTPLGYRTVEEDGRKVIVEDQVEQAAVLMARELRSGGMSFREIARSLTDAGHKTKRGKEWHGGTVFHLMEPRYLERCVN